MSLLLSFVMLAQVLSALGVIILVLLQHGKGADMGAAFGSGSSGSLFGASGSANFLSRSTGALATVFFVCTLVLAFISQRPSATSGSVMDQPVKAGEKGTAAPKSDVPSAPRSDMPSTSGSAVPAAAGASGAAAADPAKAEGGKAESTKADSSKPDSSKPTKGTDIPK